MDLLIDERRECLLEATGHVLVTGGPGSGKTTVALAKAQKKIEAGLDSGQSVLFLSFSRAAVSQILEASKMLSRENRHSLCVQTFHSFFWEILRGYGYLLGSPRPLRLLLPQDERVLRDGAEDETEAWAAERERLFVEQGLVAFDLFAPKTNELLQKSARIRNLLASRHPLVIVDEAQDTAEDQWSAVRLFGSPGQLICLGDLDQQIYDYRPGVTAERLTRIMAALNPLHVDLASDNHRSSSNEIVRFGNDILLDTPRGAAYKGVSGHNFAPRKGYRDAAIRKSIGIVSDRVRKATGAPPQSIAVLATWGRGVNIITKALTGDATVESIPHRVVIDEAPVLLSSRLIAFLLEPIPLGADRELEVLAAGLELAVCVFRSKNNQSWLQQASRLAQQAAIAREGQPPKTNTAGYALIRLIRELRTQPFSGDPRKDWVAVRKQLANTGAKIWLQIAQCAEQLVAFQRGTKIASSLTELWQTQGTYAGARRALDAALAQDSFSGGADDLKGIHVMTIHKSKAKEFDAVIILDEPRSCPLLDPRDKKPFHRSRKLFRVGITRARHHLLVLSDASSPSPLLDGHRL